MANYTETTNFTALTTAQAVINGAAFDLEYGNIATAIRTKLGNEAGATYAGPFNMVAAAGSITLSVSGASGQISLSIGNPNGAGNSFGFQMTAGSTSADYAFTILNFNDTVQLMKLFGDGGLTLSTATDQGIGTINVTGGYYVNGTQLQPSGNLGVLVANGAGLTTSRASTTTVSNDTNLHVAIPAAGVYNFTVTLVAAIGGANGIDFNINYSGSFTASGSTYSAVFSASTASPNPQAALAYTVAAATSTATILSTLAADSIVITGTLIATGAGTLALGWGPNSSNATPSTVSNGLLVATRYA